MAYSKFLGSHSVIRYIPLHVKGKNRGVLEWKFYDHENFLNYYSFVFLLL